MACHQHHNAPVVDIFQIYGGSSTEIAGEGFRCLQHYLLPDPRLGDPSEALDLSLSIMLPSSFCSYKCPTSVGYLYRLPLALRRIVAASKVKAERQKHLGTSVNRT
jgi:hypothetical protein